ncbi:unnamed protein product [Prorocentrum cordatum]|uniref:Uncharacterized protein n=1 Tax=Prorocentrum cordatum TaxID=2364126 RepID=A0ABN9WRE0_9DINO|nr:unnamed protein product [Polarella glacialis]
MQIYPSPLPAIETMGRENSMHMNFRGPARRSEQLARSLDGSCWRRVLPFEFGRACAGPPLLVPPTASSRDPVGPGAQAREQEGPSLPTAPPRRDPRGRIWRPSSTTALSHQGAHRGAAGGRRRALEVAAGMQGNTAQTRQGGPKAASDPLCLCSGAAAAFTGRRCPRRSP